jgi:ABC-type transport system substrate-binding protein
MMATALVCLTFGNPVRAVQDQEPELFGSKIRDGIDLVDQDPFDRVFLDEYNGLAQLDIIPLVEVPPTPLPQRGYLVFELMDNSWPTLQVPWENVSAYKTFDTMLLEEADQLIKDGQYAKAFRNLLYVKDKGIGTHRNIDAKLQTVLFLDGKANYDSGNYTLALSLFEDLYARDPRFRIQGISLSSIDLILDCYNRSLEQLFTAENYRGTQLLLNNVSTRYEKASADLVENWKKRFEERHDEFIASGRQKLSAGEALEARVDASKAISVLPERREGYELYDEIVTQTPMVFIATTQPAVNPNPNRIEDWASRRIGRLTQRRLTELVGLSDEGGRYEFLNGRMYQVDDNGFKYRFEIEPEKPGFAIPPLQAYQLRTILLKYADPRNPEHKAAWAKILKTVSVTGPFTVEIELKTPFVRPDALLNFPYLRAAGETEDLTGPYVTKESTEELIRFDVNDRYTLDQDQQYPELVEWRFPNSEDAVEAILSGRVDAIDRVAPSSLPELRQSGDIEVRNYLVPTIHMLVPNVRNEFVANPTFRSGLLKAINRDHILFKMICDGGTYEGMEVLNGPFPIGTDRNQQIAYAYNSRIPGVQYSRVIGATLVEIVRQSVETRKIKDGETDVTTKLPEIVIAYPQGDVAAIACQAIKNSWDQIEVPTKLRPLPPGVTIPEDGEYDFLYVELTMTEPLAESEFLFGPNGLAKSLSAPIEQMMRQVAVSNNWRAASTSLKQLHRQVLNDVTVIPLWQTSEFYAFRRNLRDVGRDLLFLYQNVDRWKIGAMFPDENPLSDK